MKVRIYCDSAVPGAGNRPMNDPPDSKLTIKMMYDLYPCLRHASWAGKTRRVGRVGLGKPRTGIKQKFFNHLVDLDHSFHITHKTGSLISRLTRGRGATERLTDVITFNIEPMINKVYYNLE